MDSESGEGLEMLNDPQFTAVHEAAHAVVGRAMTMVCGLVTIEADENSAGHSLTADQWEIFSEWNKVGKYRDMSSVYRGRIMTLLAGAVAEEVLLGENQGADEDDWWQCSLMADAAGFDPEYVARLRHHVFRVVRHHKKTIRLVADELLRRKTISGEQVDDLISSLPA